MTIKQLEYFKEIYLFKSLSKAANVLHISQPPLTYHIKELEKELHAKLFVRNKHTINPTTEGEIFYQHCMEILDLVEKAKSEIKNSQNTKIFDFKIGTIGSFNSRVLPNIISDFLLKHPNANVSIIEANTNDLLSYLAHGKILLAFVRKPFKAKNFCFREINDPDQKYYKKDCLIAIGKKFFFKNIKEDKGCISLKSLKDLPLILHNRYSNEFIHECLNNNFNPKVICSNNNIQSSISWAETGKGIAIVPFTSSLLNTNKTLVTKNILGINIDCKICVCWKSKSMNNNDVKDFLTLI